MKKTKKKTKRPSRVKSRAQREAMTPEWRAFLIEAAELGFPTSEARNMWFSP